MAADTIIAGSQALPESPGVYFFQDATGRLLYIGKARNLRARVRQHETSARKVLSGSLAPGEIETRTALLLSRIQRVRHVVAGSELEALVLEDYLIKKHWPRFNVRQKKFLRSRYLILTDDPLPRLKVVHHDRRGAYAGRPFFGPFRDEFAAGAVAQWVNRMYGLRPCPDERPDRLCSSYDLGQCPGPCAGEITRERYLARTRRALRFLSGSGAAVRRYLARHMQRASASLSFEHAARARDDLRFMESYTERVLFWQRFGRRTLLVHTEGEAPLRFDSGRPDTPFFGGGRGRTIPELHLRDRADVILAYVHSRPTERSYAWADE